MFRVAQTLFGQYSPTPLNDVAVPPFPLLEADEESDTESESRDFDVECPQSAWRALPSCAPPADAPVRFIDGSIASRTVGAITVGKRRRPLIAAAIAAACLEIEGGSLQRAAGTRRLRVLCLNSNGIDEDALREARHQLAPLDVQLLTSEAEHLADFDSMRRSTRAIAMHAMEDAERDVTLANVDRPSLVDGLLEHRLAGARQNVPVVGLVKRQIATYLPPDLQELAYSLKPGERTPAFLLRTAQSVDLLNSYIRLSSPAGASPSYGLVRLAVPIEYVRQHHAADDLSPYLSGLAGYLYDLRHRDYAYSRAGISIEPIVRVEEHLHALRPDLDVLVRKLHPLFTQRG
jgi:hypothetical protein